MIYYAVIYMNNGEIHLKPFDSKEEAQARIDYIRKSEKWGNQVVLTKIVKKDSNSPWFQSVKGFWI